MEKKVVHTMNFCSFYFVKCWTKCWRSSYSHTAWKHAHPFVAGFVILLCALLNRRLRTVTNPVAISIQTYGFNYLWSPVLSSFL